MDVDYTNSPASPPDPPQDRTSAPVLEHVATLLHAVGILLGYGRHLFDTVRRRAAAPTFSVIAANFGTANLDTILAHLQRGILRATAMQRILLARAKAGRDINIPPLPIRSEEPPARLGPQPGPSAGPSRKPASASRRSRPVGCNDPEFYMPTLEELERQVLRRTIGRTITDICLDLGVVPGFCTRTFWNKLFDLLGSGVVTLMKEKHRRHQAFLKEQDRTPGSNWDWLYLKPDEVRRILGFFIGEPPVNPFAHEVALATGPP